MNRGAQSSVRRTDERLDETLGALLRTGVILAAAVVFIGGMMYLTRHSGEVPNYKEFRGEPVELRGVSGILREVISFRGRGLIQFGLLILIATPIARVAFSLLAFVYRRDWIYVIITFVVLGLLSYSLLGGRG